VPASGRTIDLPAVFVHEVRDTLVVAERQYRGLLEFLVRAASRGGSRKPCELEWAIQDSNLGPLPYQRSALTD
jgi:hypothetical protein